VRSALEVADVFRRHGAAYREAHAGHLIMSGGQRRVMGAIETGARQRWAVMSNSATAAVSFASPTIPVLWANFVMVSRPAAERRIRLTLK